MRRRETVLDYLVQNRKGQPVQGAGSSSPDLGVELSVTLIQAWPHELDLVSSSVIYSSVHSMNMAKNPLPYIKLLQGTRDRDLHLSSYY